MNQVFGSLIKDGVGLAADRLKYYRLEKIHLLHEKTKKRLQEKGIEFTEPVPPKIGIPLIEQAAVEEDDDLHSRWANMLSNAMDPKYKGLIKRSYVTILGDMEALDVLILDNLAKEYSVLNEQQKQQMLFDRGKLAEGLGVTLEQCEISLRNLMRLGCLRPGVIHNTMMNLGGHNPSTYKDTELVGITALGLEFYSSVN